VLVALAALVAATCAAAATAVDDRAATPLERGAFVAMPAVYDLVMDQRVDAIVVRGRRTRVGRTISIRGTAFGVAPGRVVTARHVASPTRREMVAELVAVTGLAVPSDLAKVRIVATRPRTLTLVPAHAAGDPEAASPPSITAEVAKLSDAVTDLALLRIPDTDAPTLALNDTLTRGTPAAVVGFGDQPQAIPAVRAGTLDGPRVIAAADNDGFGGFEGEVLRGDSGAPVVDSAGQAHGVVLRLRSKTAPVISRAESVRKLLAADGATPAENAATSEFRAAMSAFWRRDYAPAATSLTVLLDAQPDIPLVRYEQARATALQDAPYGLRLPSRRRGLILAVGAMATLSAAALGAIRIRRQPLLP
jgi:hypothetical protein